jgi:hypothetical protein
VTKKIGKKPKRQAEFFELVNWKKAQPKMKEGSNSWMKLYTSLLEHEGFDSLDDSARMLMVALWLYAARSGMRIFPADPNWIAKKIPMLNSKPNLKPLMEATDLYGNPTPFIRICKPPTKSNKRSSAKPKNQKTVREEKKRREEKREDKREETKPLRVSKEEKRKEKKRISTNTEETAQPTAASEHEKPENPIDPEAGSAKKHFVPKSTRSVFRYGSPQNIGSVIAERFPDHWQDPDAESFGWEVVEALGYSADPNNIQSRSEWGSFASWWCKIKSHAPSLALDELREKAIQKANYLRIKGNSAKNKSKVWFYIMDKELKGHGITLNLSARASPG